MSLLANLRLSFRTLTKDWSNSLMAVIVMGIGLGLSLTMLTQINGVLWSKPAAAGSDLQVLLQRDLERGPTSRLPYTLLEAQTLAAEVQSFDGIAIFQDWFPAFSNPNGTELAQRVVAARVDSSLFGLCGVRPLLGSMFTPDDQVPGADTKAIISHDMWQRHYGGEASALGQDVILNGRPFTIIGVMPEGFRFPSTHDLWLPAPWAQWQGRPWNAQPQVRVIGRLKPGVSNQSAETEINGIIARFAETHPEIGERRVASDLEAFNDAFVSTTQNRLLWLMLGFALMVLAISCANVSNLVMARTARRSGELAVRSALGASRGALVGHVLVEGLVICLGGIVVGLGLAYWGAGLIWDFYAANSFRPYWWHMDIDWRMWISAAGFMIVATFGSSLIPALRASRVDTITVLKDDMRTSSGIYVGRLARTLTTLQIALSGALLVTATMMIFTLRELQTRERSYDPDAVLTVHLRTNTSFNYETKADVDAFVRRFKDRAEAINGIDLVATTNSFNFLGIPRREVRFASLERDPEAPPERVDTQIVSPDYFDVLRIQPLQGRVFSEHDVEEGMPVCLVSQRFAQHYWPRENPIGQQLQSPDPQAVPQRWRGVFEENTTWMTVVGVVPDIAPAPVLGEEPSRGELFLPSTQILDRNQQLMMRGSGDLHRHIPAIEALLRELDPHNSPKTPVHTVGDVLLIQLRMLTLLTNIFTIFGVSALLLAFAGLYSVVSFSTRMRTREFGVRVALGAQLGHIISHVLKPIAWQVVPGTLIGLAVGYAFVTVYLPSALNFDELPQGLPAYSGVLLLTTLACLSAALVPAWRAARADPVKALRAD